MSTSKTIKNKNTGAELKLKPGATCKTKGIIYAIKCKKCDHIYIGHTGDSMSDRFSKHKYDIKNRPQQNELAAHCHKHKHHDTEKDLEVFIIDHGMHLLGLRILLEDKYICKLQTLYPNEINTVILNIKYEVNNVTVDVIIVFVLSSVFVRLYITSL